MALISVGMSVVMSSFVNPNIEEIVGGLAVSFAFNAFIRKLVVFAVVAELVKSAPKVFEKSWMELLPPKAQVLQIGTTRELTATPMPIIKMGHIALRISVAIPVDGSGVQKSG